MSVRYYDKSDDTVKTLTGVTKIEPVCNGLKLALDHATTPLVILTCELVEVTP